MRVMGLMSGTSLDGIDAVLVEIGVSPPTDGHPAPPPSWRVMAFETVPFTVDQRRRIHDAIADGTADALAALHVALGEWFADAALAVCRAAGVDPTAVDMIGSHGQTVWHRPPAAATQDGSGRGRGYTLQLGDPATIAEVTGIPVVSDFRSRDMAAGGEGAPLVPWVDALLFAGDEARTLVNVGGMANVTRVPPQGSGEPVVAFDTGPGNAIIDAAMEMATGGARHYDANGEWARRGRVDEALVEALLADAYFRRTPPKSTGRERYGADYVTSLVADRRPSDRAEWAGLVATLTAVVARSIAGAIERWADPGAAGEVVVTGGGVENPVLMEWLRSGLGPRPVRGGDRLGVDPAAKEALAFAVLAWAHVVGRPANLPSVTGAAGPRVLGSLTPGRDGRLPQPADRQGAP